MSLKAGSPHIGGCRWWKKNLRLATPALQRTSRPASQQMLLERIRRAPRAWLYRKICYAEQREILMLLDGVVQNGQGVLLQLETACEMIPHDSPAKEDLRAALKRAEILLEELRNQAEIHTRRSRARRAGAKRG
jgi:hypothetical protein